MVGAMAWVRAGGWSVVAGALVAWAPFASAEPGKWVLRWSAPPECPTEADVVRSVEQLLGASDVALEADASVARRPDGFHLSLSWRKGLTSATRELTGDACSELAQAAALMIALAAEPSLAVPSDDAAGAAAAAEPAPAPAKPPPVAPAPPPAPRAAPRPSTKTETEVRGREPPPRFVLSPRLGGAVDTGSLPRATVGGFAGVGLRYGPYALVVEGLAFAPQETNRPAGSGRFWLGVAALRPCALMELGELRVLPCAAAELHAVPSRGLRVRTFEERVAWFLRFGASAEVAYPLTRRLRFVLGGALLLAPSRPRFVVDSVEVFTPELAAGRGQLGFELDF
jgi:hypothetical protein